jgi:hypothetical protein
MHQYKIKGKRKKKKKKKKGKKLKSQIAYQYVVPSSPQTLLLQHPYQMPPFQTSDQKASHGHMGR